MRSVGFTALLLAVTLSVSLSAGELVLRVWTAFPISETSNMQSDPELLYTADPGLPEIDENGFRNPAPLLEHYDLVAIGDSHTYGNNARPFESWPARIAEATGVRTYNMGMPGYSVYQYDVLFDRALELQPRQIIVGLYPANDWLPDCALLALDSWQLRRVQNRLNPPCGSEGQQPKTRRSLQQLLQRTAIGSAFHELVWQPLRIRRLSQARRARGSNPDLVLYEVGGHTFSFGMSRVANHARGTDLAAPRTAAAYADGLKLIRRWRDVARAARIHLAIAIIPSKERVLREWAHMRGHAIPDELRRVTENEPAATDTLKAHLAVLGVPFVDALPAVLAAFERSLETDESVYPQGFDGHPYASGYAAYAAAISELVMIAEPAGNFGVQSRNSAAR